jgi:hypothetical protein
MTGQSQDSGFQPDALTSIMSKRSRVVAAAHSPLGFCALALLIVEAFLWGSGVWFGLSEMFKIAALGVGVLLFLFVFVTVVWLVVKYPKNLVFSEESHVQVEAMQVYASKNNPVIPAIVEVKTSEPGATALLPAAGEASKSDSEET